MDAASQLLNVKINHRNRSKIMLILMRAVAIMQDTCIIQVSRLSYDEINSSDNNTPYSERPSGRKGDSQLR